MIIHQGLLSRILTKNNLKESAIKKIHLSKCSCSCSVAVDFVVFFQLIVFSMSQFFYHLK